MFFMTNSQWKNAARLGLELATPWFAVRLTPSLSWWNLHLFESNFIIVLLALRMSTEVSGTDWHDPFKMFDQLWENIDRNHTSSYNRFKYFCFAIQGYRPSAERASILFFVLNDMGRIDPMYQFSLDAYIELFIMSIEKSQRSSKLEERIQHLNEYHTYAVYRYVNMLILSIANMA